MGKIYCSNCGQPIPETSNFCRYCGAAQHGTEAATYRAQAPLSAVTESGQAKAAMPAGATVPIPERIPRRHLAPIAAVSFALNYLVRTAILLPLFVLGFLAEPLLAAVLFSGYLVILYLAALAVHQSFYFTIDEDGFTKEYGIIHKKRVSIPYEQVQNVNIVRNLGDRLLGLSRISIETAGSSRPYYREVAGGSLTIAEGHLPGVTHKDAAVIHDLLLQKAAEAS